MKLPKKLRNLAEATGVPFQAKWEFGFGFDRYYESRYKGHLFRYYEGGESGTYETGYSYVRNKLKLFHSRPLYLGLQCYFNVGRISPTDLRVGEGRNVFASRLDTSCSDIRCYAAEKSIAEALLSQGETMEALTKLQDLAQKLPSGGFAVQDDRVMFFFDKNPDEKMLDTMHQLSTVLSESMLLPNRRRYWTFDLGLLLGILVFLICLTLAIIVLNREGFMQALNWPF